MICLDPKWWYEYPIPRRWHRCRAVNVGDVDGHLVARCPCGAMWVSGRYFNGMWVPGGWTNKNSRRKKN